MDPEVRSKQVKAVVFAELADQLGDPGFIPARVDVDGWIEALKQRIEDKKLRERVVAAIARVGGHARERVELALPAAKDPQRAYLAMVLAKLGARDPLARTAVLTLLEDGDEKTRRTAIQAAGKLGAGPGQAELEDRLIALYRKLNANIPHQRSVVEALGKLGGPAARGFLQSLDPDGIEDRELRRIAAESRLRAGRSHVRTSDPGSIDPEARLEGQPVLFDVREGLEQFVSDEIVERLRVPSQPGHERVEMRFTGALQALLQVRTALSFGFPIGYLAGPDETELSKLLCAPRTLALLTGLTKGSVRYRLEFAGSGHRRGFTYRAAEAIDQASSGKLLNDPRAPLWEIRVPSNPNNPVVAYPKGLFDPRFTYRIHDVPGASHPTIAAALARLAGVHEDDVVWDPFAGSGTELIERARLGPYKSLHGSDLDVRTLTAAGANIEAAKVSRITMVVGDAANHMPPEAPTVILTNPPMGRRVLDRQEIVRLLPRALDHFRKVLRPGGRLVWLSPLFAITAEHARAIGFDVRVRQPVDLGGYTAELQVFALPAEKPLRGYGRRR